MKVATAILASAILLGGVMLSLVLILGTYQPQGSMSPARPVIYVANVNFYGNGTKMDIAIGNDGGSNTTITQVYIGTSSSSMDNQTITPVSLAAGSVQRITVNHAWQPGGTYYFNVTAATGESLPFSFQAP